MSLTWSVAYYESDRVVVRPGDSQGMPTTRVLWVDVLWNGWGQRLQGRDYFWVHGDSFGLFNDPANLEAYGGDPHQQYGAWRAIPEGAEALVPAIAPENADILIGILLPDDVWEEVTRAHPLILA